jgi:hypothetical protein
MSLPIAVIFFLAAGIITISGCSASSGSLRYDSSSDDNAENTSVVRFTSDDSLTLTHNSDPFTQILLSRIQLFGMVNDDLLMIRALILWR